ncbi:1-phosphatidylinositol 4-kinase STT4 [Sporobolomyces salmoneus]|uniref:1-phosphatidylinositol 4-kinase STT4 n=1 Tax=Sporobolomyces salmoneus TaxID=183962 RepID=UPI00316CC06B
MDSLDSAGLYSQVLKSLATNLSSSSSSSKQESEDLQLLTTPLLDLPSPSTNGNGYQNGSTDDAVDEGLTSDQIEGIIAFAEYVTQLKAPGQREEEGIERQILELMGGLRGWRTKEGKERLVGRVWDLKEGLLRDLDTIRNGERLLLHVVPSILGLGRAIKTTTFKFESTDPFPSFPPSSSPSDTLGEVLRRYSLENENDVDSSEEDDSQVRAIKSVLEFYRDDDDDDSLLTPYLGLSTCLELLTIYWSSSSFSTTSASSSSATSITESLRTVAQRTGERSLDVWEEIVKRVEEAVERRENREDGLDNEDEEEVDETRGAGKVLEECLKLATITSTLSSSNPNSKLFEILDSLLLPSTLQASTSHSLQLTALTSIRRLASTRTRTLDSPSPTRGRFGELIRGLLGSEELGRWTILRSAQSQSQGGPYRLDNHGLDGTLEEKEGEGPGELVEEIVETWIQLIPSDSSTRLSALQTLLNHLTLLTSSTSSYPVSSPASPIDDRSSSLLRQQRERERGREIEPEKIGQSLNLVYAIGLLSRSPLPSTSTSNGNNGSLVVVKKPAGTGTQSVDGEPLKLAQSLFQRLVTSSSSSSTTTAVDDRILVAALHELGLIAETIVVECDVDVSISTKKGVSRRETRESFKEIGRTVGAVGRGAVLSSSDGVNVGEGEGAVFRAAVKTFDQLGTIASKKKEELGNEFLIELLTLFVHRGTTDLESGHRLSAERRIGALKALLPILASYLIQSDFSPLEEPAKKSSTTTTTTTTTTTLGALFRSFWYISLLSSLFSSKQDKETRRSLEEIAKRSPTLVSGSGSGSGSGNGGDVWVEIEAQINGLLKNYSSSGGGGTSSGGVRSIESLRGDLATELPSQAGLIRGIETPKAVFLSTVMRLEALRASATGGGGGGGAGRVEMVFEYFKVKDLAGEGGGGMGDCLKSIAEKVLLTYISQLSHQVPLHSVPVRQTTSTLKALLYETTNPQPEVRALAYNFLNELFGNFPSLVTVDGGETARIMLELLTVVRKSCLSEFLDEYTPTYTFSTRHVSLTLPDDYPLRQRILRELHQSVRTWLKAGMTRSPEAMKGLLMHYIEDSEPVNGGGDQGMMPGLREEEEEMGKSVALDLVRMPPSNGKSAQLPAWGSWNVDSSASFAKTLAAKSYFGGEAARSGNAGRKEIFSRLLDLSSQLSHHKLHYKLSELRDLFFSAGGLLVKSSSIQEPQSSFSDSELLHFVVSLPVRIYTEASIQIARDVWTWIVDSKRDEFECRLIAEVVESWNGSIERGQGLFSRALDNDSPLNQETQFTPTDKNQLTKEYLLASRLFAPMLGILEFLSSRFQAFRYRSKELALACMRLVSRSLDNLESWTHHPLSRELRFRFLAFGFCVLQGSEMESIAEFNFRTKLFNAAFDWFEVPPAWSFGTNRIQMKADLQAVEELTLIIESDFVTLNETVTSSATSVTDRANFNRVKEEHSLKKELLITLMHDEADRLKLWLNPTQDSKRGPILSSSSPSPDRLVKLARFAWKRWSKVVVHLPARFKFPLLSNEVTELVRADPLTVQDSPHALAFFIDDEIPSESRSKLRHLLYWAPVTVPEALRFLFPKYGGDSILLQYALRVLEHHPVGITFFYIPQVVQALRNDSLGYAERFIFETSKISQLFCHQIIWNMKANAYRGDDAEEEDPMKPILDRVVDMIVDSLSGEAQDFYNREFSFFDEVTSISAKLKPFIKASKAEKKKKIDEEMAKIKVDVGVYLPSNPDGVVVDINRKSGRPLQSHAKAPFMATFKVRRQRERQNNSDLVAQDELIEIEEEAEGSSSNKKEDYDTWQSAIFKVGDDCRQDVLALQIIAMHKNIFNSLGLDLLVTPYRVTATGPGCGVIDVVPNATSRDEMGRAKINDLLSFFTLKYGPVESIEFQKARTNFIQSMAAYSLLCYIIQIKDRHNGNIMIDGRGCITHIDFGFLFDIGPGGIKFEPNSFKLSKEMVVMMGEPGYRTFVDLVVKAFLACRPYANEIVHTTSQMLAAEFPSFKGEPTMDRLRERFRLDLSEKDAAVYMMGIISDARENKMSLVYDQFVLEHLIPIVQYATNGIPYTR